MKKQEKQKQKIKEVLLKILHIVSYVLSLAFIGLCILTGAQSCSAKQNKGQVVNRDNSVSNAVSSGYKHLFQSVYQGTYEKFGNNILHTIASRFGYDLTYDSYQSDIEINDYYDSGVYINNSDNQLLSITRCRVILSTFQSGNTWKYYLNYVHYWVEGDNNNFFSITEFNSFGSKVIFQDLGQLVLTNNLVNEDSLLYKGVLAPFYKETIGDTTFTFGEKINYNAPFGYLGKNPLIPESKWNDLPHLEGALEIAYIDTCYFLCNGQLYNRILIYGHDAHNYYYHFGDSVLQYTLDHTLKFVEFIAFVNTKEGHSSRLGVWTREVTNDYQGKYVIEDNGFWGSSLYKEITLFSPSDTDLINFTQFNSDLDLYQGGITFYGGDNVGVASAFSLMRQAFGSLIDLMGISILPGLTLGVFIFLPLIATIIVLIFKAVRK